MKENNNYKKYFINFDDSIKNALIKLSKNKYKCLIVLNHTKVVGTLTDGDIRRFLIVKPKIDKKLSILINKKFIFYNKKKIITEDVKPLFDKYDIPIIPHIYKNKFKALIFRDKYLNIENKKIENLLPLVMAGGKGTRLSPFTDILPKPLIPLKNKPIIDYIFEFLFRNSFSSVNIILNYKKDILKSYLKDKYKNKVNIFEEKKLNGTASSIKLLRKKKFTEILVVNCDNIFDLNINELYKFHKKEKNLITVVSVLREQIVPYGLCKINKNKRLTKIIEKPKIDFMINAGMYVLDKSILKYIPPNRKYDMTNLIDNLLSKKKKISVYPILDSNWTDVGEWQEYEKASNKF